MDTDKIHVRPKLTSYLYSKAARRYIPLSGTFELTPMCNFTCKMCYVRKSAAEVKASPRRMLTKDQWFRIAEEAKAKGLLYLLITGGEPFSHPDFWDIYEGLIEMGFLISINTNGSLIDQKCIERLKLHPPVRVNITLYGASDETYEALCGIKGVFQKVTNAIEGLQRAKILVKLNGSITPTNVSDLEECVDFAEKRHLIYEPVTYMFPPLRRDESLVGQNERFTPEEAARYNSKCFYLIYGLEQYRMRMKSINRGVVDPLGLDESCVDPIDGKIRCRAGKAGFWVTWDGYMTPCGMMTRPKVELVDRPFMEAWNELTDVTSKIKLSGACDRCPDQKLCHACAAMALAETGTFEGVPRYLCQMVREMKKIAHKETNC